MDGQLLHAMLPQPNHDELARQQFVHSLKQYVAAHVSPGNRAIYEQRLKPQFEQEHQRSPETRHEVRQLGNERPLATIGLPICPIVCYWAIACTRLWPRSSG